MFFKILELEAKLGRKATIKEISEYSDLTEKEVVDCIHVSCEIKSLNTIIYKGDSSIELKDTLKSNYKLDEECEKNLQIYEIKKSVSKKFGDLENKVFTLRLKGLTQNNVGEILGINQIRVSRIENKILKFLKNNTYLFA